MIVDLFAGPGGADEGARLTGYDTSGDCRMTTATAKTRRRKTATPPADDRFDPFAEGAFDPAETPIGAELAAEHTRRTETGA